MDEKKVLSERVLLDPITTQIIIQRALMPVTKEAIDFIVDVQLNHFMVGTLVT